MRAKDVIIGNTYLLKADSPYLYADYKDLDLVSYTNKDLLIKVVKIVEGITSRGISFNLEIETKGHIYPYRFYINSYYLIEDKSNHVYIEDDYNSLMQEEKDYQEFQLHLWYEHNLIDDEEINNDWDKELVFMGVDFALENNDLNRFKQCSKKLREIKER